jgi:hypothetical protein
MMNCRGAERKWLWPNRSLIPEFELMFLDIVMCRGLCVTYRRILDWMTGFIDNLYTQLGNTGNYSTIAIPTLYSSLLHSLVSSVFTSRILATDS